MSDGEELTWLEIKDSFVILFWRSDSSESRLDPLAGVLYLLVSCLLVQIIFSLYLISALSHLVIDSKEL